MIPNRRTLLSAVALASLTLPAFPAAAAPKDRDPKVHNVVLHVGANDPQLMSASLNYATNLLKYYAEKGETANVEILANGPGLHMLREDTSPVKGKVLAFATRHPQVVFSACQNTKENMEAAEGKEVKITAKVRMVPSGVVRLMELQENGWSYIWP
jgi:intracellular sulfur oxidation DsrE/DsrF family protein